jgi:fumarate hydratase class II
MSLIFYYASEPNTMWSINDGLRKGNDVAITVGGMQGHYELNVLNP